MKVLMISKGCYQATYRSKLEELARLAGVELTLLVPPYWRFGEKVASLEGGHTQGYRLAVANPFLNGHHHLHFYPTLGRLLRQLRPELLHIDEEPYDFVTFHALLAAKAVGAKVLFFTWQNLLRSFPPPFGFFEGYVLRHADAAIAGSQEGAQVLRRKGYSRPLFVLPQFGVDPDLFAPGSPPSQEAGAGAPVPERASPFRIGYVGRLVPEKGIWVLLEAVRGLVGEWQLILLGDGPLGPQVEGWAQKEGLSERVKWNPGVPSAAMPAFYRQWQTLVLPSLTTSRWKEQFGRVLIEAMACQVPVVGSSSGEIPQVIGEAGLLFPEGDALSLRQCLQRLRADPSLRCRLGRLGRERVLQHFTQAKIAAQTHQIYRFLAVVGGGPPF